MFLFSKIRSAINKYHRRSINRELRERLQNHGMSVLSSNCVGAFILHDLNEPFNSPFVNLFIMMTDKDSPQGMIEEELEAFDRLPFKNKVVFTHKPYPHLKSVFYIRGFEQNDQVGDLFAFSGWNGKKYYDQFDYIAWFNQP